MPLHPYYPLVSVACSFSLFIWHHYLLLENIKVNLKSRLALNKRAVYHTWLSSQEDKCGCAI